MRYILEGHTPVLEPSVLVWAKWMENNDRIIARDTGNFTLHGKDPRDIMVSTVFLGLDHSFGGDIPILFETMVFFDDGEDIAQERYCTWDEAVVGHNLMMKKIEEQDELLRRE